MITFYLMIISSPAETPWFSLAKCPLNHTENPLTFWQHLGGRSMEMEMFKTQNAKLADKSEPLRWEQGRAELKHKYVGMKCGIKGMRRTTQRDEKDTMKVLNTKQQQTEGSSSLLCHPPPRGESDAHLGFALSVKIMLIHCNLQTDGAGPELRNGCTNREPGLKKTQYPKS